MCDLRYRSRRRDGRCWQRSLAGMRNAIAQAHFKAINARVQITIEVIKRLGQPADLAMAGMLTQPHFSPIHPGNCFLRNLR